MGKADVRLHADGRRPITGWLGVLQI
jgi:hypothetical protein